MSFITRAIISILTGIGSGLLGFWAVWRSIESTGVDPGIGYDAWILTAIFLPGVVVPLIVFRTISQGSAASVQAN